MDAAARGETPRTDRETSAKTTAQPSDAAGPRARGRGRPKKIDGEANQPPLEPGVHLIRRYGNRRLYDAQLSRCVTLSEIADFVRRGENVRVVDADSGADLTKRMLVQIILEEPGTGPNLELFPVELLRMAVTLRNEKQLAWLERYLSMGTSWLSGQGAGARPAADAIPNPLAAFMPWLGGKAPTGFTGGAAGTPLPNPFGGGFPNPFGGGFPNPFGAQPSAGRDPGSSTENAAPRSSAERRDGRDAAAPQAAANEAVYQEMASAEEAQDSATLRDEVADLRRRLAELDSRVKRR